MSMTESPDYKYDPRLAELRRKADEKHYVDSQKLAKETWNQFRKLSFTDIKSIRTYLEQYLHNLYNGDLKQHGRNQPKNLDSKEGEKWLMRFAELKSLEDRAALRLEIAKGMMVEQALYGPVPEWKSISDTDKEILINLKKRLHPSFERKMDALCEALNQAEKDPHLIQSQKELMIKVMDLLGLAGNYKTLSIEIKRELTKTSIAWPSRGSGPTFVLEDWLELREKWQKLKAALNQEQKTTNTTQNRSIWQNMF